MAKKKLSDWIAAVRTINLSLISKFIKNTLLFMMSGDSQWQILTQNP